MNLSNIHRILLTNLTGLYRSGELDLKGVADTVDDSMDVNKFFGKVMEKLPLILRR